MADEKEIRWLGSSHKDVLDFPAGARREIGFQLGKVQAGIDPDDWKPFDQIGAGTREIRVRDKDGIHRVMYVASFTDAIYVLHCFQKKTQSISRHDRLVATMRYKAIAQDRKRTK